MSDIRVELLDHTNMFHLEKVKTLGIANTKTLGLFPPAAFDDYARRGRILVAVAPHSNCAGYVLFSLTNDRATIFHLCVDDAHRGGGIARLLLDALATRAKHLRGISLKCRRDYAANDIWPKFGFQALDLGPGRNKAGLPLVTWWRSNGGPDLFSDSRRQLAEVRLPVVIDANIVFDFQGRKTWTDAASLALRADWLRSTIDFWVTPETSNEATKRDDAGEAHKSLRFVRRFPCLECDQAKFTQACADLKPYFGQTKNNRDESDFRQIAWAIAAGSSYFVTRDGRLRDRAETIADVFKLQILEPVELIVQFDELRRAEAYQPASLAATALIIVRIGAQDGHALAAAFQNHSAKETKGALLSKLKSCIALPDQCDAFVVSQDANPLAIYTLSIDPDDSDTLLVPLLRTKPNAAGTAAARHIAQRLVQETIHRGRRITMISDDMITDAVRLGLTDLGFFEAAKGWAKISLPTVARAAKVADAVRTIGQTALSQDKTRIAEWATLIASDATIEDEHSLWPAKITNLNLPAYVIPIEPRWAAELFDVGLASAGLFSRDTSIGINTEAVYYRSCRGCGLQAPGRVLWYVSEDKNESGTKAARASSRIQEVVTGKPKDLFRKFRRLGIYQWDDVYAAANRDVNQSIMAIRFAGTELFRHPIPFRELSDELKAINANPTMVGPVPIPQDLFLKLYSKAVR